MELGGRGSDPSATELRPLLAGSPPPSGIGSPHSPATTSRSRLYAAHLLYEALVAQDLERFSTVLAGCTDRPAVIDHCHGDGFTCLQYTCDRRLTEFAELLLRAGADPAVASPASGRTALHWAAARDDRHLICRLLESAPELDVNVEDAAGVTPLQLAVDSGGSDAVLELLRAGVDVSVPGESGRPLLHAIPADLLETFLDSCLHSNGCYVTDRDCCLKFDYRLMWPRRPAGRPAFETAALFHLSTSRAHRHLLRHPLVESFIDLKWWQVRPFFVADLLYYVLFLTLLTTLVVLRDAESDESRSQRDLRGLHSATAAVMAPMVAVKILQLVVTPTSYVLSDKNGLLKAPLLMMTAVYLGLELDRGGRLQLAAMLMLFAWMELFALLSRIPAFSIYARMLQTVMWRFLSFMAWYLALIVGLTLSTYIMFKESGGGRRHPAVAFLRPFVMTMDKVDLKSLPVDSSASAALLVCIMLFFVMTVTLTNLVNALAVTDISVMRKHARIFSLVSRVHLLTYTESMMLDEPCEFLGRRHCSSRWCRPRRCRRQPERSCLPPLPGWVRSVRHWLARIIGPGLRLRLSDGLLRLYPNQARPAAALLPGQTFLTKPALPRGWRFSTERVAAARRLARQPAPRASLALRLSQLERQLSQQPDHGP